jgi:hypothetical protein
VGWGAVGCEGASGCGGGGAGNEKANRRASKSLELVLPSLGVPRPCASASASSLALPPPWPAARDRLDFEYGVFLDLVAGLGFGAGEMLRWRKDVPRRPLSYSPPLLLLLLLLSLLLLLLPLLSESFALRRCRLCKKAITAGMRLKLMEKL